MKASSIAKLLLTCFHLSSAHAHYAQCDLNQHRKEYTPSGEQIKTELISNLKVVCSGAWPVDDTKQLEHSFNYRGIVWKVKRADRQQSLRYCDQAMGEIIDKCILHGNSWGGTWSFNGENYTIYNSVYPKYPLAPTTVGISDPSTDGPSHSKSSTPHSKSNTWHSKSDTPQSKSDTPQSKSDTLQSKSDTSQLNIHTRPPKPHTPPQESSTHLPENIQPLRSSTVHSKSDNPEIKSHTWPTISHASHSKTISAQSTSYVSHSVSNITESKKHTLPSHAPSTSVTYHPTEDSSQLKSHVHHSNSNSLETTSDGSQLNSHMQSSDENIHGSTTISTLSRASAPTSKNDTFHSKSKIAHSKSEAHSKDISRNSRVTSTPTQVSIPPSRSKVHDTHTKSMLTRVLSASQGSITLSPQTAIETGKFATATKTINGLTANSATTTTINNKPTVLPIWFIRPNIGIIVVPLSAVTLGGIVPPPPGYPALKIGSDGSPSPVNVKTASQAKHEKATSTLKTKSHTSSALSSASTCSTCATCTLASVDPQPIPTNIADIPRDFPFLIPGGKLPSGTTNTATPLISAAPIDHPICNRNPNVEAPPDLIQLSNGNFGVPDLLYRMRKQLCADSCAAPAGVQKKAVSVKASGNGANCEISVRLSQHTEVFMFRTSAAKGAQRQQCLDSTKSIIDMCINQRYNEGKWTGNHLQQLYQAGIRPWFGAPKSAWLPPAGISHPSPLCLLKYPLCTGYVGIPAVSMWKRSRSGRRGFEKRAEQDQCGIKFQAPGYPSTSKGSQLKSSSAQTMPDIGKWWHGEVYLPEQICTWWIQQFPEAKPGHTYATEHIYEKHFVKTFLNWLNFNDEGRHGPVADCASKKKVFDTRSTTPDSPFAHVTPAQALANALTCYSRDCPDNLRVSEFMILESGLNRMKTRILGRMSSDGDLTTPSLATDHIKLRTSMVEVALVFRYMSNPQVATIFNTVNERMRNVLKAIDRDPFYTARPNWQAIGTHPETYIRHESWTDAYDYWMSAHLKNNQMKSDLWIHRMVTEVYPRAVEKSNLSEDQKKREIFWAKYHRDHLLGIFHPTMIAFGDHYIPMMQQTWKARND